MKKIIYTKKTVKIGELPSGDKLSIVVHTFQGSKTGPSIYIQGNLHGPEIIGIPLITKLLTELQQQKTLFGKITLITSVNPIGLSAKIAGFNVGYTNIRAHNKQNWNTIFKNVSAKILAPYVANKKKLSLATFEKKYKKAIRTGLVQAKKNYASIETILAYTLQNISFGHDYVIDVHTAQHNIEHVYSFSHSFNLAKEFGISYVVEVPAKHNGCFDESNLVPYIQYMQAMGKPITQTCTKHAFTLEFYGGIFNQEYINQSFTKMWHFLSVIGLITDNITLSKPKHYFVLPISNMYTYHAPIGGILIPVIPIGGSFTKGQVLATISSPSGKIASICAIHDGVIFRNPLNQIIPGGDEAINIFISPKKL